eukprot:1864486-Pleurochrysis_carterae.AAC.1
MHIPRHLAPANFNANSLCKLHPLHYLLQPAHPCSSNLQVYSSSATNACFVLALLACSHGALHPEPFDRSIHCEISRQQSLDFAAQGGALYRLHQEGCK